MTGAFSLAALTLAALSLLVVWAAASDVLHGTIPNAVSAAILGLWVIWAASGANVSFLYAPLIGVAIFLVGAVLFRLGQMGGGDVKLLTVLGVWAGPQQILPFLIHVFLIGGLLTLLWLVHGRVLALVLARDVDNDSKRFIPYGVAISIGALLLVSRLWAG